jgi:hypothetical protein
MAMKTIDVERYRLLDYCDGDILVYLKSQAGEHYFVEVCSNPKANFVFGAISLVSNEGELELDFEDPLGPAIVPGKTPTDG